MDAEYSCSCVPRFLFKLRRGPCWLLLVVLFTKKVTVIVSRIGTQEHVYSCIDWHRMYVPLRLRFKRLKLPGSIYTCEYSSARRCVAILFHSTTRREVITTTFAARVVLGLT